MEISAEAQSRQADTLIRRVDAAAEAARNVEDKIGRVQRESVVAVGMMAAVLIVFWAAVGWSSSVLQNIEKATVYRLSGMSLLLVIGLFNLVAFLMAFIRSMTGTEDRKFYRVYMWGNGLLVLLLFLVSVAWLFDLSGPTVPGGVAENHFGKQHLILKKASADAGAFLNGILHGRSSGRRRSVSLKYLILKAGMLSWN